MLFSRLTRTSVWYFSSSRNQFLTSLKLQFTLVLDCLPQKKRKNFICMTLLLFLKKLCSLFAKFWILKCCLRISRQTENLFLQKLNATIGFVPLLWTYSSLTPWSVRRRRGRVGGPNESAFSAPVRYNGVVTRIVPVFNNVPVRA